MVGNMVAALAEEPTTVMGATPTRFVVAKEF